MVNGEFVYESNHVYNYTCISDIRTWMIKNKLKINDSKTEFLVLSFSFFRQQFNDL